MKTSGTNYIALSRSMGHLKHAIALRSFPAEYFAYFLFVSSAPSGHRASRGSNRYLDRVHGLHPVISKWTTANERMECIHKVIELFTFITDPVHTPI